jgi:ATP-dependent DNA helicase
MVSSSITGADSESQKSTPPSSPPLADMDGANDAFSKKMQEEEDRIRVQREIQDAKRDAELEKEREDDIRSGKEVLDKKFQQLEFLMNKSKVNLLGFPYITCDIIEQS